MDSKAVFSTTAAELADRLATLDAAGWERLATALDLSHKEQTVAQLLLRGLPTKTIARQLRSRPATVNTHLQHIYRKLNVHNRTEAASRVFEAYLQLAIRDGKIAPPISELLFVNRIDDCIRVFFG